MVVDFEDEVEGAVEAKEEEVGIVDAVVVLGDVGSLGVVLVVSGTSMVHPTMIFILEPCTLS